MMSRGDRGEFVEGEGMSEWKEANLDEVVKFQRGHDLTVADIVEGIYPVAGSNGIIGYHKKFTTKGPGITLGRSGNSIGVAHYYENDFWAHNTTLYSTNFFESLPKYVFYFLKTIDFAVLNSGSAVPSLNRNHIHNIRVKVPPLPEQKAIARIFSSLDDKIDLLHRQNKTLEAIAETLFRQWFIEEAQADWEVQPLGNLVTVKRGGSPRPIQDFLSKNGYRWLKISDATKEKSPFIFSIKEYIKESGLSKTTLLKAGSLVLSNSATPGIPKILQVDSCIHDGWLHFPESYFSNEFLFLLFNNIRPELIQQGNGSIFTNLKTEILKEYKIPTPTKEQLKKFQESVELIFNKILINARQIQTLEKLRDTLLPKLMSGEVRVTD